MDNIIKILDIDSSYDDELYDIIGNQFGASGSGFIGLFDGEKIIGGVLLDEHYLPWEYRFDIVIKDEYQNKGYSNLLIKALIDKFKKDSQAEQLSAIVINNGLLRNLVDKFGFGESEFDGDQFLWLTKKDVVSEVRKIVKEVLKELVEKIVYHGTTIGAAIRIQKNGLKGNPLFLSNNEEYSKSYADRKGGNRGVVLRMIQTDDMKPVDNIISNAGYVELTTNRIIPADDIEVEISHNWVPISKYDFIDKKILKENKQFNKIGYHGTNYDIKSIDDIKINFDSEQQFYGPAFYVTEDIDLAKSYGKNIYKIKYQGNFMKVNNPINIGSLGTFEQYLDYGIYNDEDDAWEYYKEIQSELKEEIISSGYDGVIDNNQTAIYFHNKSIIFIKKIEGDKLNEDTEKNWLTYCKTPSDNIRFYYIQKALNSEPTNDTPNFKKLTDIWNGYDDLMFVVNRGDKIDYYEGFVNSCWDAIFQKNEYKGLSRIEVVNKLINYRIKKIGEDLGLKLGKVSFKNNVLSIEFDKESINENFTFGELDDYDKEDISNELSYYETVYDFYDKENKEIGELINESISTFKSKLSIFSKIHIQLVKELGTIDEIGMYVHDSALRVPIIFLSINAIYKASEEGYDLETIIKPTIYHELGHAIVNVDDNFEFIDGENILKFENEEDFVEDFAFNLYTFGTVPDEFIKLDKLFSSKFLKEVKSSGKQKNNYTEWSELNNDVRVDIIENIYDNNDYLKNNWNINTFKEFIDDSDDLPKFKIEFKSVDDLYNQIKNKRQTSDVQIEKLIKKLKNNIELDPILVDGDEFFDGAHRLYAYKLAGRKIIPTINIREMLKFDWESWLDGDIDFEKKDVVSEVRKIVRETIEEISSKRSKKLDKNIKESTGFEDGVPPVRYVYSEIYPTKTFKSKDGNIYRIFVDDKNTSTNSYYLIIVKTIGVDIDKEDSYGNKPYQIGGDRVGYLFLNKGSDGVYRSKNTMSYALWVREDLRRSGIATAMHDYANKVIGIETDISNTVSSDARGFWKDRNNLNEIRKIVRKVIKENTEDKVWYHGTPDVRDLKKEGGFSDRTISIEYIDDLEGYYNIQSELSEKRGTDEYFKLLDKVKSFKKTFKMRSPIFLTDNYIVASSYADPKRSFDYQGAEEKVLKVRIKSRNGVKIFASGDRFRFIDIEKVKNGFIDAGISADEFDDVVSKFNFYLRNKKGIKTNMIAAIGEWFGFDYIDVIGVLDSYHGGSVKSTVRMAFNVSDLKILK